MKEHPILMSGPMVRAILEGQKVMTRRVMNPQPEAVSIAGYSGLLHKVKYLTGDSLWVRETWTQNVRDEVLYKADWQIYENKGMGWKPSIYMPRWASRIALEVTAVKVERLQDISEADAIAEGIESWVAAYCSRNPENKLDPVEYFGLLWNSINAARGYGWEVNPWVWCVSFKRKD